ncbi:chemotaxis protein CheW [Cytobacillus sp. Hz8]|uniref:chemotaxis protein CheW n=1 Tax=Cytobacillus sp. Hz8 TaxID=3347168 RepID=UPI0035E06858
MSDQFVDDSILEIYIFESSQMLEQLEEVILKCEEAGVYSTEMINDIFRIMHTIKGSSSMMSFNNIASLAHVLEDLFSLLREEKMRIEDHTQLTDLMLDGVDFIKVEIEKVKHCDPVDGDSTQIIEQANNFLKSLKLRSAYHDQLSEQDSTHVTNIDKEQTSNSSALKEYVATVRLEDCGGMEDVRAFQIIHQLKEEIHELTFTPEDLETNFDTVDLIRQNGLHLFIHTDKIYEEMEELFSQVSYVQSLELKEIDKTIMSPVSEMSVGESPQKNSSIKGNGRNAAYQSSFLSVNVLKLDELMDLVGELVIAESMVTQNPDLVGLELEQFTKAARHLKKITDEIQDKVMSIRMVPLTNTFQKMNRIVRDMSKKLQKEVQLELIGEDTEVDKNIIEHISDPLMHIVRNSLDHGIESCKERMEKGKPKLGTLTLKAKNAGNEVLIFVRDDGRGLNKEKLINRAKENHLLHKNESEMSDREIYNLIFLPGFSTKDQITEFSGRGVGMDVVTKNIGTVGGTVTIDSEIDKGTTIIIRIPLTLAIIDGMNIRVGKSRYTLPTTAIKESFRPAKGDIITDPEGNEMIMVRGQCYPILRLHECYGIRGDVTNLDEGVLIMAEQEGKYVCLFADELLGQQQVVVKSLPDYIKKISQVKGITGCTLLGDGSISLILDISGLIK